MIDVSIRGVLNGIAAGLADYGSAGRRAIYPASIGAHVVVPTTAVYCATREYAVLGNFWGCGRNRKYSRDNHLSWV